MMTGLKEALQNISSKPVSDEELEQGARHLIGYASCLSTFGKQRVMGYVSRAKGHKSRTIFKDI